MRGEVIGVWKSSWRELWAKLAQHPQAPEDLFCELYRSLVNTLELPLDIQELADVVDNTAQAKAAFKRDHVKYFVREIQVIEFLETAHPIIEDMGGDALANRYYNLLDAFIEKYSLRYDLRRPCTICPTVPGMFATLVRDLRLATSKDAHLHSLMGEYEEAIRDLRDDRSDGRIKTCIQKQVNLLEAMGQTYPGVSRKTLGAICNQVGTWPHNKVKEAMQSLYGFASDYPGIRHGGTATSAIRTIDMRDLVAMSILLVGFTPYLADQIDADVVYEGR